MKSGKEYELLIEQIYKELQSDATIIQDDHLPAYNSGGTRQIDLTIRYKVANIDILIIVQVKDFKIKAKVGYVDEFLGVMNDVRADKGIMICSQGFSQKAINAAKTHRIQLYSAHTAKNVKWHKEIGIPTFKIQQNFDYEFEFTMVASQSGLVQGNRIRKIMFRDKDKTIPDGELIGLISRNNELKKDGEQHKIDISIEGLEVSWADTAWSKLEAISLKYRFIKTDIYSSNISPKDYRLLQDCANEKIEYSFLEFDLLPLILSGGEWRKSTYDIKDQELYQHLLLNIVKMENVTNFKLQLYKPKNR